MEPLPPTQEPPVIEMTAVTVGSLPDPAVPVLEEVNWTVSAGNSGSSPGCMVREKPICCI